MFKFSRLPLGLLALTVAAPVFAQPATTQTSPTSPSTTSPSGTMAPAMPATPKAPSAALAPQTNLIDLNSATAEQLKALPGVSEADSTKIIRGRPYADKGQLVSRHVLSETTYDKIKDHVVAKPPKS
jgi:DNA uptake protein ComE-like DNA-binding protein